MINMKGAPHSLNKLSVQKQRGLPAQVRSNSHLLD